MEALPPRIKPVITSGTSAGIIKPAPDAAPKREEKSNNTDSKTAESRLTSTVPEEAELIEIIEKGFKDKAPASTSRLLQDHKAEEIINNCIVPALDNVGKDFEKGKKFLPQLLLSADTVSSSFAKIKESLEASGQKKQSKGTVVLATVYGDIHDIGKNIVRAMLENYGYTVIDLGKNVPVDTVVQTVIDNNIQLVGLSALMTTTVANMEETIKALRRELGKLNRTTKIVVGGAVLTEDYAKKIDADFYSKDAMETVAVAKKVFA
ncbi:MAG: cobalamin-dependent protein [Treponema sp.]|nr:cobalamin-dependent protein [Treponema sp.]